MKPTPVTITLESTRLPGGETERREATILIDVIDTDNGRSAGLVSLKGGSTGYESFRVASDLSNLEEAARAGWTACAGTERVYPRCHAPAGEMRRVLAEFRATQARFRQVPDDVVNIFIGTASTPDSETACILLNRDQRWKEFLYRTDEITSGSCFLLQTLLHALDQLRHPCVINVVTDDESFCQQVAEPDKRRTRIPEEEQALWLQLDHLLDCAHEEAHAHHLLDTARGSREHLLVRACRRTALQISALPRGLKHYGTRGALLKDLARAAQALNQLELNLSSGETERPLSLLTMPSITTTAPLRP